MTNCIVRTVGAGLLTAIIPAQMPPPPVQVGPRFPANGGLLASSRTAPAWPPERSSEPPPPSVRQGQRGGPQPDGVWPGTFSRAVRAIIEHSPAFRLESGNLGGAPTFRLLGLSHGHTAFVLAGTDYARWERTFRVLRDGKIYRCVQARNASRGKWSLDYAPSALPSSARAPALTDSRAVLLLAGHSREFAALKRRYAWRLAFSFTKIMEREVVVNVSGHRANGWNHWLRTFKVLRDGRIYCRTELPLRPARDWRLDYAPSERDAAAAPPLTNGRVILNLANRSPTFNRLARRTRWNLEYSFEEVGPREAVVSVSVTRYRWGKLMFKVLGNGRIFRSAPSDRHFWVLDYAPPGPSGAARGLGIPVIEGRP